MKHIMKTFAVLILALVIMIGCAPTSTDPTPSPKDEITSSPKSDPTQTPNATSTPRATDTPEPTPDANKSLSFGDTFTYDGFEITVGDKIVWDKVDNPFADTNGKDVFGIELTVKNVGDSTARLSFMSYTLFGTSGSRLDDINAYFDKTLDDIGELRSGGAGTGTLYFLYENDGDYYIEFGIFETEYEIKIPVKKP